MMMSIGSSSSLHAALTTTVYFIVILSTCCTKECGLQLAERTKNRSVVFRNVDIKLCQTECIQDSFIFASCPWSSGASNRSEETDGSSGRTESHPTVLSKPCGSKACSLTSHCVENGCGNVCVKAPSLCDLHTASKTGDLSKVKFLLSQGQANVNCHEWIGRTPVMWAAHGGHREVVGLLVSKGANVSLVDRFGINILHSACLGGDVEMVKYILSQNILDMNGRVQCGRTAVMLAAENGHKDVVELLVGKGADMSLVDETGDNILHCACRGGDVDVVKYILSRKVVDIDSRGSMKMTPIMVARHYSHREVVELLVSKGADGSLKYYNHKTMLYSACQEGDVEMVKFVLSQNIVDINSRGLGKKTPVMNAAETGRKEVVELLVSKGADVSLVDTNSENVLHWACVGGHVETVKYVLSLTIVDINSRGWKMRTPVMATAERGHTEVVRLLVSKGANVSLVDRDGENVLHWACVGGYVETVKYVLSQIIVDINSRGWKKRTPVMAAAERGRTEVVELLVVSGADVFLVDMYGENVLHWACVGGYAETVNYVLSQSIVDINSREWKMRTPVMATAERGHTEVVRLLVSKGANVSLVDMYGENVLHWACVGGYVETVKYVLSQSIVDINSRGWKKRTPVMVAAERGRTEVVELLVVSGADVFLVDMYGENVLHWACVGGYVETVKYVLSQSIVDINSRGWKKRTPVMAAAERGHVDVIELLVSKGADVSLMDTYSEKVLHWACVGGHAKIVSYILSWNIVDINSRGFEERTPVMAAAELGHKDVVEVLVSKRANISLEDKGGNNILHYACQGGNVEVVKYILSQSTININCKGVQNMTPVMVAAKYGRKEVVEFLVSRGAESPDVTTANVT